MIPNMKRAKILNYCFVADDVKLCDFGYSAWFGKLNTNVKPLISLGEYQRIVSDWQSEHCLATFKYHESEDIVKNISWKTEHSKSDSQA
jgi:hypothetical protein